MTIAKLQQFLAVCQFQSVTRAAEFLHISQPSVSGTIRELEHEFQVNLFRHEGRRLVLTAEGSFLREHAQQLIRQFDELSWQMEDLRNQKNRFRIGIPPMSGTIFFPQLYQAFQRENPEITLLITECGSLHAEKLLARGELDLAMATLPASPSPEFSYLRLARTQLMLCVSPAHRLANAPSVDISMLRASRSLWYRYCAVARSAVPVCRAAAAAECTALFQPAQHDPAIHFRRNRCGISAGRARPAGAGAGRRPIFHAGLF